MSKFDYTVIDIYGHEYTSLTFKEAKEIAKELLADRADCDPIIDQFDLEAGELSGKYYHYRNGKFEIAKSLKELMA